MDKKLVLIALVFVLTGCENQTLTACFYSKDNAEVYLDINAINDDISSIHTRICFDIPNSIIADKEKYDFIVSQIDNSYHFEDNLLVKEYEIQLNDIYSLSLTKDYLKKMRFYCE